MHDVDLNLLSALDVLLTEGSVTAAARRLSLSPSAMSRALTRLRASTGDPLLVRAGRRLVPTPHAQALRGRVHALTLEARSALLPVQEHLDLASLNRTFTIAAGESFMEMLSGAIVVQISQSTPRVRLRFAPRHDPGPDLLRDGRIDLEIGGRAASAPELHRELLFEDSYVGVARIGHPLLTGGRVTARRYAACAHVQIGDFSGPVDAALEELDLVRTVQVVVPGFPDALRIAAGSDLIALLPRSSLGNTLVRDRAAQMGVQAFEIPLRLPAILVSAFWHPRMEADPAHRWLRGAVIAVCRRAYPSSNAPAAGLAPLPSSKGRHPIAERGRRRGHRGAP